MSQPQHHIIDVRTNLSPSERRCIYQKLQDAALKGDWKTVESCYSKYERHEISCNTKITRRNETVLHLAVTSDKIGFVKHVVGMMSDEDLAIQDDAGNTAFLLAVIAGKLKCVEVMMKRKTDLAKMRGGNHHLPLCVAASKGYRKIILLLYSASKSYLEDDEKINVFIDLIYFNIYDVALDMLKEDKKLALGRNANDMTALQVLAQKSSLIEPIEKRTWKSSIFHHSLLMQNFKGMTIMRKNALELMKCIWDIVMELEESEILDLDQILLPPIFTAAKTGNIEFLTTPFRSYPNLMLKVDKNGNTIFHIAILHRQEKVFKQIHHFYSVAEKLTMHKNEEGNNMLHLAAKLPEDKSRLQVVPGAALQLQRELLWFEEVKKVVPLLHFVEVENAEGKTPEEVFIESHEEMMKEGEKWMKGTASKCILVATLIATMVFEGVMNATSGESFMNATSLISKCNNEDCFREEVINASLLLVIADALSLILAVASVIAFLGIITSRFQLQDYCGSLPLKFIVGFSTLYFSLGMMLAAFGEAIFISFYPAYHHDSLVLIPIAFIPLIVFVWMEGRLLAIVIAQTFLPRFIFRPHQPFFKSSH